MAMVVKNNMSAVSTLNTLNKNSSALQKSLAKVSSGMKINSAQDDASGYAISEKMRVQIRSLDQANQNTQNASSMMKTAEGAVSSTVEILKSLKEKAINAATDTNTDSDRKTIQKELDQFIDQIDDNALTTFNGKYLVDGSKAQYGEATYTKMTNQSLATDTAGSSKLTDLANRNNESLEIESTDYVTASYVKNGETHTTKFQVGDKTLQDIFSNLDEKGEVFAGTTATAGGGGTSGGGTADTATAAALATIKAASKADLDAIANVDTTDATALAAVDSDLVEALATVSSSDVQTLVDDAKTTIKASTDAVTANGGGQIYVSTDGGTTRPSVAQSDASTTIATALDADTDTSKIKVYGYDSATYSPSATESTVNGLSDYVNAKSAVSAQAAAANVKSALAASAGTGGAGTTTADITISPQTDIVQASSEIGQNSAGDKVLTADGTEGLTISSRETGIKNMVAGVTISVTDSEGNVKKSANAALDDFTTTIYAKNKSDRNELTFQVGAAANQSITVGLDDMRAEALGLKSSDGAKVSVATQDNANAAIKVFDNAIQKALDQQTTIGAVEARLEYTGNNLTTSSENVQAAESTIRDADMAKEMTAYTKNNVLLQAAQSMLAQANQSSSQVLSLLQ